MNAPTVPCRVDIEVTLIPSGAGVVCKSFEDFVSAARHWNQPGLLQTFEPAFALGDLIAIGPKLSHPPGCALAALIGIGPETFTPDQLARSPTRSASTRSFHTPERSRVTRGSLACGYNLVGSSDVAARPRLAPRLLRRPPSPSRRQVRKRTPIWIAARHVWAHRYWSTVTIGLTN
jgi:hypothetical protein